MRTFSTLIILAAAMSWPATARADEVDCHNAMNTFEQNRCAEIDFDKADAALNTAYHNALKKIAANGGEPPYDAKTWETTLRAAERAWLAYREADCKDLVAIEWSGGTGTTVASLSCMIEKTEARTKELIERYGQD